MMKIALILVVCTAYVCGQTPDYCDKKLCGDNPHVACGNNGNFGPNCNPDRECINPALFKDLAINKHNEYRNKVALGQLPGFSPAVRMAYMQWDDELAKLAELNAKQCKAEHDKCHNTIKFNNSGQNIATIWGSIAATIEHVVGGSIDSWFSEYKFAKREHMEKFPWEIAGRIGHFTGMIVDRNTHFGCAFCRHSENGGVQNFFVCNYAHTNIIGRKIYESGPFASKCLANQKGYRGLCWRHETIDPNYIYPE